MKPSHIFLISLASTSIFNKCSAQFPYETRILDQQMSMDYSKPSSTPSGSFRPSTTSSDQPSRTINPIRSPSGAPIVTVSGFPIDHPSAAPSHKPSGSPSTAPTVPSATPKPLSPSFFPSSVSGFPTFSTVQSSVELRLLFSITIGINPSDVPADPIQRDAFVDVIETSFVEVTLGEVSNVTVTLPDGVRRLQVNNDDFLDLGVELVTNQACRVKDCEQFSNTVLGNVQQEIDAEILAETINQLAQANNVTVLATASVLDYQLLDQTISIDGTYASSSPSYTDILASVVVALVTSFLI